MYLLYRKSPARAWAASLLSFIVHTKWYTHIHTHTHTHTHTVGSLWKSNQPFAEATTYTTLHKHIRRTSMPSGTFGLTRSQQSSGLRPTPWPHGHRDGLQENYKLQYVTSSRFDVLTAVSLLLKNQIFRYATPYGLVRLMTFRKIQYLQLKDQTVYKTLLGSLAEDRSFET
jgi:hypothetical protein